MGRGDDLIYLNLEYNQKLSNILLKLRPNTFFSDGQKNLLVNHKLNHKIMRSQIKERGILKNNKKLSNNIKTGQILFQGVHEYQILENKEPEQNLILWYLIAMKDLLMKKSRMNYLFEKFQMKLLQMK